MYYRNLRFFEKLLEGIFGPVSKYSRTRDTANMKNTSADDDDAAA
jgi:hypothetical protein